MTGTTWAITKGFWRTAATIFTFFLIIWIVIGAVGVAHKASTTHTVCEPFVYPVTCHQVH